MSGIVAVIDYGMGNLHSVASALEHVGAQEVGRVVINSTTAGTCYMCHDGDPAAAHMWQNGGVMGGWRAEALGD